MKGEQIARMVYEEHAETSTDPEIREECARRLQEDDEANAMLDRFEREGRR